MQIKINSSTNNMLTDQALAWNLQKLSEMLSPIENVSLEDIEGIVKEQTTILDRVRLYDVLDYFLSGDGNDIIECIKDINYE